MTIPVTGPLVIPDINSPQTFSADAVSFFNWISGSSTSQLLGWLNNLLADGSNANGNYLQIAQDYMLCWHKHTLTYSNVGFLSDTWVFPASFSAVPMVGGFLDLNHFASNASADINELTGLMTGTATASQASLQIYRTTGGTNFDPADTSEAFVFALGEI